MRSSFLLRSLALLVGLAACAPPAPPPHRSFYAWQTTFAPSPSELDALTRLHVDRLYLRVFDVDAEPSEDAPKPIARVAIAPSLVLPAGVEVVPVVFLRERTFRHLGTPGPSGLARRVLDEAQRITSSAGLKTREIQLDCDWTDTTRERYFAFLRALDAVAKADGVSLTATIRLHQVKHRERTGVPPVSRGTLMFYNMGSFEPGKRAIFDAESAAKYLGRVDEYPLPLDVALPIWSWTTHVREGEVLALLQSTGERALATSDALEPLGDGRFAATRTTFIGGALVREGDELHVENTDPATALAAARMLAPHLRAAASPRTVTLFDLSERNLARHDVPSLERLFDAIR